MVTNAERVRGAITFINTLGLCVRAFCEGENDSLDSILEQCLNTVEDLTVVLAELRKGEARGTN